MRAALAEKQSQLTTTQRTLWGEKERREKAEAIAGETEKVMAELTSLKDTYKTTRGESEEQLARLLSDQRRALEAELEQTKEALAGMRAAQEASAKELTADFERRLAEVRDPLELKVRGDSSVRYVRYIRHVRYILHVRYARCKRCTRCIAGAGGLCRDEGAQH